MMLATKLILQSVLRRTNHRFHLLVTRNCTLQADDPEAEWDRMYQRGVPRTMEEMNSMLGEKVDSPPDAKLLKVAIIGVPNSGKSTLVNKLMGWRVCSVSSKVHTTQINAKAILNRQSTQLVFLDTPGLVTPAEVSKHALERSLLIKAEISLRSADIVAVLHDMSNHYTHTELHPRVLRLLTLYPDIPSILVLNKLDVLKSKRKLLNATHLLTNGVVGGMETCVTKQPTPTKLDKEKLIAKALRHENDTLEEPERKVIELTDTQTRTAPPCAEDVLTGKIRLTEMEVQQFIKEQKGWPKFQEVFMISALHGLGVDHLREYFFAKALDAPWIFNSQVVTDQNPEEIALMTVREKFMDSLKNEIPYGLKFSIEHWDLSESELLSIIMNVGCKRQGLSRFVVGGGGSRISEIAARAEQELRNTFRTEVRLRINIVYDASLKNKKFKF